MSSVVGGPSRDDLPLAWASSSTVVIIAKAEAMRTPGAGGVSVGSTPLILCFSLHEELIVRGLERSVSFVASYS